jgi:hypothetical protein
MSYPLISAANAAADKYTPIETAIGVTIWLTILAALWLLPTIIAVRRRVRHVGSIAVVNIFLGWTLFGWVAALAMATQTVQRSPCLPPRQRLDDTGPLASSRRGRRA